MTALQPVRGTRDLMPEDCRRHRHVEAVAADLSTRYGYGEIATPVFEFTQVFSRSLGETSDVVSKEMYTFEDRGGSSLTLRPENTAGVVRAFISNGLAQHAPIKLFYRGPMFRYERPQKGRMRQFHQIGVEVLGVADPLADVEVIALGAHILAELGLGDRVRLELNSLGDAASRETYRTKLVEYFSDFRDALSEDSLLRLERNPLRILDSKAEADRDIVAGAPLIADSLTDEARAFRDTLLSGLQRLGIDYHLEPRLVRGLDYYCHTAFEFTTDMLGAQNAVLAGGRYDGLAEQLGGRPTPGIGWAAGVERLALLVEDVPPPNVAITVAPVEAGQQVAALEIAHQLRRAGFAVDLGYRGNLAKRLKRADRVGAKVAIIVGEDELERRLATVRDMKSGEQRDVSLSSLAEYLEPYR